MMNEKEFPIEIQTLELVISAASGVSIMDIRSAKRQANLVRARHMVWCLAVRFMGFHAIDIARIYGKDHTSILSAINKFRNTQDEKISMLGVQRSWPDAFSPDLRRRVRGYSSIRNWQFSNPQVINSPESANNEA